jgi:hypothetical protein
VGPRQCRWPSLMNERQHYRAGGVCHSETNDSAFPYETCLTVDCVIRVQLKQCSATETLSGDIFPLIRGVIHCHMKEWMRSVHRRGAAHQFCRLRGCHPLWTTIDQSLKQASPPSIKDEVDLVCELGLRSLFIIPYSRKPHGGRVPLCGEPQQGATENDRRFAIPIEQKDSDDWHQATDLGPDNDGDTHESVLKRLSL